jgi:hypothetical protein
MGESEASATNPQEVQRAKVIDICGAAIDQCHEMITLGGPKSLRDLKDLMFVVREAWYLAMDRFTSMNVGDLEKFQALMGEDDAQFLEEEDGEEDDNPFGLG